MGQYRDLFNNYIQEFCIREHAEFATVAPPIFFNGYNESIAFSVRKLENGYLITDCHSVTDYWEYMAIDPAQYQERIAAICDFFEVYFDGNLLCKQTLGHDDNRLQHTLAELLQAMIFLAYPTL